MKVNRTHLGIAALAVVAAACGEVEPDTSANFGVDAGSSGVQTSTDAGRGSSSSSRGSSGGGRTGGGDGGVVVIVGADAGVSPPPPFGGDGGVVVTPTDSGVISFPPPPFDGGVVTPPDDSGVIILPPPSEDAGKRPTDGGVPSSDSGVIVIQPDASALDAGADAGPTSTSITCGATTCDLDTQQCCVSFGGATSCTAIGGCAGPLSRAEGRATAPAGRFAARRSASATSLPRAKTRAAAAEAVSAAWAAECNSARPPATARPVTPAARPRWA